MTSDMQDTASIQSQTSSPSDVKDHFGPAHVLHPLAERNHTHTMVMLHGRGTDAEDFADELMSSTLSGGNSLQDALPGWRWVFPSARNLWNETFQEYMPAWFEAHSLTDTKARQDLQIEGIQASVEYIQGVLDEEIARLDGQNEKVFLGGISLGGAVGIWTILHQANPSRLPCAFVGASTWLPFDENVGRLLFSKPNSEKGQTTTSNHPESPYDNFVQSMLPSSQNEQTFPHIPILLGHGTDDAYVDVELGRMAKKILTQAGHEVEWKEYSGAEQEGHWFQVPDQMNDILDFLQRMSSSK